MKKHQTGGLVDSEGRPVRDGSGNPIMTESGNQAAKDEAKTEARMEAARKKLAGEVQTMVKAKGDADRLDVDAKQGAMAPAKAAAPAKRAAPVVTKEQLAKSGLSLRDYMNKQKGLTRRDGKAPARATGDDKFPKASGAMIQSMDTDMMRTSGRTAAKEAGERRKASAPVKASPPAEKPKALAISPGVLRQREADEKRREERRELGRQRDADKAKRESETKMSPAQRSAARGTKVKEFFGMAKGGSVSSASKRADGIAQRGKTRGKVY